VIQRRKAIESNDGHKLLTFKQFSGQQVNFACTDLQKRIFNQIRAITEAVQGKSKAHVLARHLRSEAPTHLNYLLSWISDWHEELTLQCNYLTAWPFIGLSTRAIMDDLIPPRMEVSPTQDFESMEAKSLIIWAVLQVPIRMNELQEAGYMSHPVVSHALSNFFIKTPVDSGAQAPSLQDSFSAIGQPTHRVSRIG
jgi:hypothetical protein